MKTEGLKFLNLDENVSLRLYPDHLAVNATDILLATGLSLEESRNICCNPFVSSFTFPVSATTEYAILWKCLKPFIREVINLQCLTVSSANDFFQKLRTCPLIQPGPG